MDRRLDIDPGGEYGDWRWTMTIISAAASVKALSAAVAGAAACGGPPGFAHGLLGNPQVGTRLRDLFDRAAANHAALDPLALDAVLEAAVEVGAPAPQVQTLVAALEDLIEQPRLSADAATLHTIESRAAPYNLGDLAAAAQAALSKLGID